MKRQMIVMMAFCLLFLLALPVLAQTQTAATTQQDALTTSQLAAEVRKLRLEIIQQGIEFQHWKIKQLEREAQQVANERQQVEEQMQALYLKVALLTQQLDASIVPESDSALDIESLKSKLNGADAKGLPARQQSLSQREAELKGQLNQEQQRLRELLRKARA